MSRPIHAAAAPLHLRAGQVLGVCAVALLAGCVVQSRPYYYPPPPPPAPAYVPPPPPAAVVEPAPGVEVAITAPEPPPPLPDYEQPPCPYDGYVWTPGYWHYGYGGYYWVPGTWVEPPQVGVLWTPGYWGFSAGVYGFHPGYWGPHVGYYGGVAYGFGYVGVGFVGGRWEGNHYAYNSAVNNVSTTTIHNTYHETVINNVTINKVSYNGGPGGTSAAPTPQERTFAREAHVPPTSAQVEHVQAASRNPALMAKANGGHPAIAATARPAAFTGPGVVGARGASAPPAANGPAANELAHSNAATHPNTAVPGAAHPGVRELNVAHPPGAVANTPPAQVAKPPVKSTTQLAKRPPVTPAPKGNAPPKDKEHPEGEERR